MMADLARVTNQIRELSRRHWTTILNLALVLASAIQIWLIVAIYTDSAPASTWVSYAINAVSTLQTLTLLWGALGLILALISSIRVTDDAYAKRLQEASGNPILYGRLWKSKTHELAERRLDLFAKINRMLPAIVIIINPAFLASIILHQFSYTFLRFYVQQLPSLVFATILLAGYQTERRRSKSIGHSTAYFDMGSEPSSDAVPAEQAGLQKSDS
jgi:hypothetical protein